MSSFKDKVRNVGYILGLMGSHWGLTEGNETPVWVDIRDSLNAWGSGWLRGGSGWLRAFTFHCEVTGEYPSGRRQRLR